MEIRWSNRWNAIFVVADKLTKMRHLIPYREGTDIRELARLFI